MDSRTTKQLPRGALGPYIAVDNHSLPVIGWEGLQQDVILPVVIER